VEVLWIHADRMPKRGHIRTARSWWA
jgi:hypothetical protein